MNNKEFVSECYEICENEWHYRILGDQWWSMKATCEHDSFVESSSTLSTLDDIYEGLIEEIRQHHENLNK